MKMRSWSHLSWEPWGVRPAPEDATASVASGTLYEPYYLSSLNECVWVLAWLKWWPEIVDFCADHNERGHLLWSGNSKVRSHQSEQIGGRLGGSWSKESDRKILQNKQDSGSWEKDERGLGHEFPAWGHMGLVLLASFISLTSVLAGSGLGALVSQHPRRAISTSGASVEIQCRTVDLQATTMFWYRQSPKQGFILMATSNRGSPATYEQGFTEAKFPIIHPNLTFSTLTVMSALPADSSFYLCGASDTALGRDQRPKQEPLPLFPTKPMEPCGRRCAER